jgi:polyhydroxyalkanoate synthase subunit PhaC
MSAQEPAWPPGADASEALGPESGLLARLDPADFGESLLAVLARAAGRPAEVAGAALRYGAALASLGPVAAARWLGAGVPGPVPAGPGDRRFADPAWEHNPGFFALRQAYLATRRLGEETLAAGRGDPADDRKAALAAGFVFDALAPTNFLATNPAALKKAFDTGGASVAAGLRNMAGDLRYNHGRPRQVDTSGFELGRNLADPVRAGHAAGAVGAAAGQPAVDQQVLHHGPGPRPQLPGVGRGAPADRVRDLLPQPGRLDARRPAG